MDCIGDLLARDLSQQIEEIVKVDQADEQTVYTELTEYVGTERLCGQYRQVLQAIADAQSDPHEGVGIWVSGFFGSGKSYFAKNLGYLLANRNVMGQPAAELFKRQIPDTRVRQLVDVITTQIPTEVVMFDVMVDRAVLRGTERIAEVMYTVFLRTLDYATDYDVAELEIELESEGKLEDFIRRCSETYDTGWPTVRKGAQKISRASAILHAMDPNTYPTQDSWAQSLRDGSADITVGLFAQRVFELCDRRRPGKALVFIVDEVGQYVARSGDKIEDLRAVVEQLGKEGCNRVKRGEAIAPVWLVVTSQEKLDEVVAAIDSRRIELAKLQDRFRYRIDMAPADIREVATRRVLAKTDEAVPELERLYDANEGVLRDALRLERTSRGSDVQRDDFVQFYPYPPHFIELSIDIMSGLRLASPGAMRQLGGSNRTIIKQAYEVLVSDRTGLAKKPVGTLVTLDTVYELVEGNFSTEKQKDISDISQTFADDPQDEGWAARVAKVVALLELVRDLPRTPANIAACLVDSVGAAKPVAAVEAALDRLQSAKFVRNTEEGWKLQTAQEKNWETERRRFLAPKPRDRNEVVRNALSDIFSDPKLRTYRFRSLRSFRVGLSVDGVSLGEDGQVPLDLRLAESPDAFSGVLDEVRDESRQPAGQSAIYWVAALTSAVDGLAANVYASNEMIRKYDQMRAQNRITAEEANCLENEKSQVRRAAGLLRDGLVAQLSQGTGVFRGVSKDGAFLGQSLHDILRGMYEIAVPDLYAKLDMGTCPLKGSEPEEILRAANLNGLPQVFYEGSEGLGLVVTEGSKFVINTVADIAKEIMDRLVGEHSYGNRETRTGKGLDAHFGGPGYGWDRDVLRLVLATLFRAGAIEVTHQGERLDSYTEPRSREPFTKNAAFRSALFTPVAPLDIKTLTSAVAGYEHLTGETVDVDRNTIAVALKGFAQEEIDLVVPLLATMKAHSLPGVELVSDHRCLLGNLVEATAEDCVRTLAGEAKSLRGSREEVRRIREALDEEGIECVKGARQVLGRMWPALAQRGEDGKLEGEAEALSGLLASLELYGRMGDVGEAAAKLRDAYAAVYERLHGERAKAYSAAIEEIKGLPDWPAVPEEMQDPILSPLSVRACSEEALPADTEACGRCHASLGQLDSDVAALPGLRSQIAARVQEVTRPKQKMERVRVSDFLPASVDSVEDLEQAIDALREHLLKLLDEGVRIILE